MDYPFTTDGCSFGMTAAWEIVLKKPPPWNDLCIEHDKVYWRGGSAQKRLKADNQLRASISSRGYPVTASFMWVAVRVGGHPLLPFPWRWGYGWRWPRGYTD